MASSGSKSVTVTSWDTLKFNWWTVSQSVANNRTVVGWNLQLVAGSSGYIGSTASKDWSVTVNGTTYSGTNTVGISNNTTKTLASGQTTITHSADGTKTFSYSFSQEFAITFSGSSIGTKSGSGTGTLNTIPRATTPTLSAPSVNMGAAVTINTQRASSSFTHDLAYSFAGGSYIAISSGVGTSYSWTVPLSLANSIPNTTSGTVTIRCITKNGSTTVGTKTVLLTAKVPSTVVPTISTVALSEGTTGIAAQFGAYIQNKSKVKATITAAGAYSSTIKSYSTTFSGKTYTGASWTSGVVTQSGSLSMVTTVTDSRGRTAKKTTAVSVLAYTPPKVSTFHVARYDANGNADPDGVYLAATYAYSVASLGNKNTATMTLAWKRSTDLTWTTLLTGTALSVNTTYKPTTPTFSIDYQYDVRITVVDWFGTSATYAAVLPSGAVLLDILANGKGIALLKTCTREGVEIAGELPGSAVNLTDGLDLNSLTEPGFYAIPTTAVSATLVNKPYTSTSTGSVIVLKHGAQGQLRQICRKGSKTDAAIYEREYYSSAWGPWLKVYGGEGRVLWSGALNMQADHVITFPETVSSQPSGIVLVFSRYSSSTAQNYHFNSFFVHKAMVAAQPGVGHQFLMTTDGTLGVVASKYIYIRDDGLTGNDNNIASGTGTSGITYNNGGFVLRYVFGV